MSENNEKMHNTIFLVLNQQSETQTHSVYSDIIQIKATNAHTEETGRCFAGKTT